jgi:integrase
MINNTNEKASRDWGIIHKKEKDGKRYWYARIVRYDGNGKKKQYMAKADNKSHARRLRDELEAKYDRRGEKAIEGDKLTFRKLADIYKIKKLIPAEYHGNGDSQRKVAGVRSLAPVLHYCDVLRTHFGAQLIKNISHTDLDEFKTVRLKTNSKRGERSIADVNRTLALMRSIMRFAIQNGWIYQSPFELGQPLISISDEVKRERVMTRDEENRFLKACAGNREIEYQRGGKTITANLKGGREIVKAVVVVALDTAMRKAEILKLRWRDVDLASRVINIIALNTKTATEREVGMTPRVFEELKRLWDISPKDIDYIVFGVADIKRSFKSALNNANIEALHFHDLRHTAITRMVASGLPPMEIMKITGHTQWSTFARYVNPNTQAVKNVANVLSEYNNRANLQDSIEESGYTN